jgi:hypothetical protein
MTREQLKGLTGPFLKAKEEAVKLFEQVVQKSDIEKLSQLTGHAVRSLLDKWKQEVTAPFNKFQTAAHQALKDYNTLDEFNYECLDLEEDGDGGRRTPTSIGADAKDTVEKYPVDETHAWVLKEAASKREKAATPKRGREANGAQHPRSPKTHQKKAKALEENSK